MLDAHGLQLTKSLGQNFLHDGNQLRRITATAKLTPADRVLEIGPGLGPLTDELLQSGVSEVFAIEKDARLIPLLRDRFPIEDRLSVRHADALELLRAEPRNWNGWKLVANLPYSVASPLLVELALAEFPPDRMVVTLQLEVVRRILAVPDTADYGILTLLLALAYQPGGNFKIPRDCFFPIPDVDSGCVTLQRRLVPLVPRALTSHYVRLVKLAFSQRRKMMLKLLKPQWPADQLVAAFARVGIAPTDRAEKVAPEQFAELTAALVESIGPIGSAESLT